MLNSCFPDSFEQYPYSNLINYNIDPNQNQMSQISDYSKYDNQKKVLPINVKQQNYAPQNTNRANNSNIADFSNYPGQPANLNSQHNNVARQNTLSHRNYPTDYNIQTRTKQLTENKQNSYKTANQDPNNRQFNQQPRQDLIPDNNYPTYNFNSQGNLQLVPNNTNSYKIPSESNFNAQYNNQIDKNVPTQNYYQTYNSHNQYLAKPSNNNFNTMRPNQNNMTSNQQIRSNFHRNNRTIPRTTGLQKQDYFPEITKSNKSYYQKSEASNSLVIDNSTRKKFDLLDSNFFSLSNSNNNIIKPADYPDRNNNIEQRFFEDNLRLKEQINTDQLKQKNRNNLIPQI